MLGPRAGRFDQRPRVVRLSVAPALERRAAARRAYAALQQLGPHGRRSSSSPARPTSALGGPVPLTSLTGSTVVTLLVLVLGMQLLNDAGMLALARARPAQSRGFLQRVLVRPRARRRRDRGARRADLQHDGARGARVGAGRAQRRHARAAAIRRHAPQARAHRRRANAEARGEDARARAPGHARQPHGIVQSALRRRVSRARARELPARAARISRSRSPTSISSSASTICTRMRPATRCCAASPRRSASAAARATCSRATAARSSCCASRAPSCAKRASFARSCVPPSKAPTGRNSASPPA